MAQDRAGELGEEALDELEPGPVLGRERKFGATCRSCLEPGPGFFRDVCGMIVQDLFDRGLDRIGGIEKLEDSMNSRLRWRSLTRAWTFPVSRSIPANKLSVPWRLYS